MGVLREICGDDNLHYELTRELLHVEQRYRTQARRAGLYDRLEQAFRRNFYSDVEDATDRALRRKGALEAAKTGQYQELPFTAEDAMNSAEQALGTD